MDGDCDNVTNINTAELCIRVRTAPSVMIVMPMKVTTFCMKLFERGKADFRSCGVTIYTIATPTSLMSTNLNG
jgi:hypothetical protein